MKSRTDPNFWMECKSVLCEERLIHFHMEHFYDDTEEGKSYRFGTTWGWANDDRFSSKLQTRWRDPLCVSRRAALSHIVIVAPRWPRHVISRQSWGTQRQWAKEDAGLWHYTNIWYIGTRSIWRVWCIPGSGAAGDVDWKLVTLTDCCRSREVTSRAKGHKFTSVRPTGLVGRREREREERAHIRAGYH